MAKNVAEKVRENIVAALDQMDGGIQTFTKATAVVKRRIEELEDHVSDLEAQLVDIRNRHATELQSVKDSHLRELAALQTRLQSSEEKLRKVQQTLA